MRKLDPKRLQEVHSIFLQLLFGFVLDKIFARFGNSSRILEHFKRHRVLVILMLRGASVMPKKDFTRSDSICRLPTTEIVCGVMCQYAKKKKKKKTFTKSRWYTYQIPLVYDYMMNFNTRDCDRNIYQHCAVPSFP